MFEENGKNSNVEKTFPIQSTVESLGAIIGSNNRYRIPNYQRPYEWVESNIDDFLNSIIDGFRAAPNGRPVFFGTIQFDLRDGKTDIVDGQQRLTTFLLFLSVIKEINPNSDIPDYNGIIEKISEDVNKKVSPQYREKIIDNKTTRYYMNKVLLYEKIVRIDEDEKLDFFKLYQYIIDNVYFVRLITSEMLLSDVISVFNTINTTGMDLNASDIFKIKYFDYLDKHYLCPQDDDWMAMINKCYKMVDDANIGLKDYQTKIDMSWILDVYKHIICAKFKFKYRELSKGNVTFFEELFSDKKYEPLMNDPILKYESFISLVSMFIEYHRWIEESEKNSIYPSHNKELFSYQLLSRTRYSRYWTIPFVAAYYSFLSGKYSKEQVYINSLKINLSFFKYFFIYSVIYAKVINSVQNAVCSLLTDFVSEDYDTICSKVEGLMWFRWVDSNNLIDSRNEEEKWEKEDFKKCLTVNLYDNSNVQLVCVLSALLDEIEANTPSDEIKQKLFNWRIQQYDIEHIWARERYENAGLDKTRKDELNGIGNLIVLNRSVNRSIKDDSTIQKKEAYLNVKENEYRYRIVETLCNKYKLENWEENELVQVRRRQEDEMTKITQFMDDRSFLDD